MRVCPRGRSPSSPLAIFAAISRHGARLRAPPLEEYMPIAYAPALVYARFVGHETRRSGTKRERGDGDVRLERWCERREARHISPSPHTGAEEGKYRAHRIRTRPGFPKRNESENEK